MFTTSAGEDKDTRTTKGAPQQLQVIDAAPPHLDRLGLTREDLLATIEDPEDEWVDHSGQRAVVLRGDHALVLGLPTQIVLSILPASQALATRPRSSPPMPRHHGGSGTRYPTSMRELRDLLRDRGVHVELSPSGHFQAEHQGRRHSMAATPSDHRSLFNTIKSLERELRIDLRRPGAGR